MTRDVDVVEYTDAGHSFANELPPGVFGRVARIAGFGFEEAANDDAWARTISFFRTHLG